VFFKKSYEFLKNYLINSKNVNYNHFTLVKDEDETMYMYRFYMRQKQGYPYPCADYDKTWAAPSLSAAVEHARTLNQGRIGMEIYKVEEIGCGETEYL